MNTIQPSTIYIRADASKLMFADILNITPVGSQLMKKSPLHAPYIYNLSREWGKSSKAMIYQDRFSVGVVLLEILIGTDFIITAKNEYQLEKLLQDCSQYFDTATATVLDYLIFDEGHANLETYVSDYV